MAVAVCAASGCTASEDPTTEPSSDAETIVAWIDQAEEFGVDDHQIALLERSRSRGTVTYADVDEAFQQSLRCYAEAGLEVSGSSEEATSGSEIWFPTVSMALPRGVSDEEATGMADVLEACNSAHNVYIQSAYLKQPSSRAAQDAVWLSELTLQCLEERGYDFPDDVTIDDVVQANSADVAQHGEDLGFPGACVSQG